MRVFVCVCFLGVFCLYKFLELCASLFLSLYLPSRKKKKMPPPEEIVIGFAGRVLQDRYSLAEYNIQVRDFFLSLFSLFPLFFCPKIQLKEFALLVQYPGS